MDTEASANWSLGATFTTEPVDNSEYQFNNELSACDPTVPNFNGNVLFSDPIITTPLEFPVLDRPIHAEVCVSQFNVEKFSVIESNVVEFLRSLGPRHVPTVFKNCENHFTVVAADSSLQQTTDFLQRCVASIHVSLYSKAITL